MMALYGDNKWFGMIWGGGVVIEVKVTREQMFRDRQHVPQEEEDEEEESEGRGEWESKERVTPILKSWVDWTQDLVYIYKECK